MSARRITVDGNEAAASIAYRASEAVAIYPITPASPMGELADAWAADGKPNLWGQVPQVVEMQSEGGAAGAVHGSLQAGALTTSFTASQGLLLWLPDLYKIAGELTSFVLHVAARTVATHALSIFGDHSDVMATRGSGFALLASGSVQEAHDLAAVAHRATLDSRIPFLHFFDGFRTSHEVAKVDAIDDETLRAYLPPERMAEHRARALSPERPVLRGSAQNPDVFFQAREACQPFYLACPELVQRAMDELAAATGRAYRLFDYVGHPEAERVLVLMGSGAECAHETVERMAERGERVGVVKVRLYRPFSAAAFVAALPPSVRAVGVLDRTKEPGATGDPLHLDVLAALAERSSSAGSRSASAPRVVGGRYGLSSKEFGPELVEAALAEIGQETPRNHFTLGIVDDVCQSSLEVPAEVEGEPDDVYRAVFFGLGSDGTVGANRNSIKILGDETDRYVQGYFVYDSKKAGATTVSHLRISPRPIRSSYLVRSAQFVACHRPELLDRFEIAEMVAPGGTLLLNSPLGPAEVWDSLPREVQEQVLAKRVQVWTIDAQKVAGDCGLGVRVNTILQTCFFALTELLPTARAIEEMKRAIEKSYGKRGPVVVQQNFDAVDRALDNLHPVPRAESLTATRGRPPAITGAAPEFVQRVTAAILAGHGDRLPVSAFTPDGTFPLATSRFEKRNLALDIPAWEPDVCIQCNQCAFVCPHAAIRAKVVPEEALAAASTELPSLPYRTPEFKGQRYVLQVAPEDCTGCRLCVHVCPAKDRTNPRRKALGLAPRRERIELERERFAAFLELPEVDRTQLKRWDAKATQFLEPLFEFSGACAGCGETPYIKLLTQLFGDRLLVANATGCSSIYGGNLPTTPWSVNREGRGPAWSNSLFEDNAEFGFGMRLALDVKRANAERLLRSVAGSLPETLVAGLLADSPHDEAGIAERRRQVGELMARLPAVDHPDAVPLAEFAEALLPTSVWLVGGDGWAYDIGFGGLDHVLAQRRNLNVLVLDTEVYSNTGGQQSKATPLGAAAKFAVAGKETAKKDLGLLAMSYGHVYVARIAFGAKINQTVEALREAESYPGPSLVIAYSHCIAHGFDLEFGCDQQKLAVESGIWPLYRFDPRRIEAGDPPLRIDSTGSGVPVLDYLRNEARFRMVEKRDPERFRRLARAAQHDVEQRVALYQQLSHLTLPRELAEALAEE